jgi:pimeloyl-ACP methyl ester carboxylesterase
MDFSFGKFNNNFSINLLNNIADSIDDTTGVHERHIATIKESITSALQNKGIVKSTNHCHNRNGGQNITITMEDNTIYNASVYGNKQAKNIILSLHGVVPYHNVRQKQFTDQEALYRTQHWTLDLTPHVGNKDPHYEKYTNDNYDMTTRTYLAWFIKRLLENTWAETITLEGISKWWYDALSYAAIFPEHIDKLLLISPSWLQETLEWWSFDRSDIIKAMRGDEVAIEKLAPIAVGVEREDIDSRMFDIIKQWARDVFAKENMEGTKALKTALSNLNQQHTRMRLEAIKRNMTKTYLAGTANDHITPPETFNQFKESLGLSDDDILFLPAWGHAMIIGNKTYQQYNQRRLAKILSS